MLQLRILSMLFISMILWSCSQKNHSKQSKPNVLLIVVDDLGYADFSPYKNHAPDISTPNMERLAKSGVVYTEAYTSAPVCSPSRSALNTGKYQFRWDKNASWAPGLPESVKTIAEYLKEAGYTTARIGKSDFGKNYHNFNVREYPTKHGYDYFLGFSAHAHDYWLTSDSIALKTPDPNGTSAHLGPLMINEVYKSYPDDEYLTDIFTDEAIKYMATERDQPFFLTLSYNAVHHVIHEVPQKYLDKYDVKPIHNYDPDSLETFGKIKAGTYSAYYEKYTRLGAIQDEDMRKYYLANLNCLDDNIGRVLDAIEKEGLDKNTMIVFISDNGGSPITGACNTPLSGGKYSLWEGGIRVPMALCWKGHCKAGEVNQNYVSSTDILPTIAEAAGINLNDQYLDGKSLLNPDKTRLLVWRWGKSWAVRKGAWKLTNTNESWGKGRPSNMYIKPISNDHSLKLFNLDNDAGERMNLADKMPEKVEELKLLYENWVEMNVGNY